MEPAILRACKQIYHEAAPVLYSRNIFRFSRPNKMLQFLERAGPANIKLIRFLDMRPIMWRDLPFQLWLTLLNTLAVECTGLRHVRIYWATDETTWWNTNERTWRALPRGDPERGLGDNLAFVRALVKIKGLERMIICGYYGKHWPTYLERETGAYVREEPRFNMDPRSFLSYCDSEDPEYVEEAYERQRLNIKKYESLLRDFQKDTEDLIP
ncbi:hypothetical protein GE09DRAFT_1231946 [Coniochaeta sp. 2T2.1]|nr:hypothetical protein GE09DRAFT_1231946 [Coniochaeta sp. 2T2.1]